jgi:hypothetical protein
MLAGRVPVSDRGDALDLHLAAVMAGIARLELPPWSERRPEGARRHMVRELALVEGPLEPVESEDERWIPGPAGSLRARVYRPRTAAARPPVVVYFHGGGFVVGSIETHDRACRTLARTARAIVISVEYRLAPEHPYPAAVSPATARAETSPRSSLVGAGTRAARRRARRSSSTPRPTSRGAARRTTRSRAASFSTAR